MQLLRETGSEGAVGMLHGQGDDLAAQREFILRKVAFSQTIELGCGLGEKFTIGAFGA